jgi:hypothetical protein
VKMLALFGGLCCVGFINLIGVVAGVRKQGLAISIRFRFNSQSGPSQDSNRASPEYESTALPLR